MCDFKIYDSLSLGSENGLSAEYLVALHGLKSTRHLRKLVAEERENGALIASGDNGYYRPARKQEVIAYYKRFHSMSISIWKIAENARKALRQFEGQVSMFDLQNEVEDVNHFAKPP